MSSMTRALPGGPTRATHRNAVSSATQKGANNNSHHHHHVAMDIILDDSHDNNPETNSHHHHTKQEQLLDPLLIDYPSALDKNKSSSSSSSSFHTNNQRGWLSARSIICYLLCGSRLFQQCMRNTLTNVLIYMARDMDISTSDKGSMLAAIATGYFFTQVPGGALADKFGPKNVLTASLVLSACCCLAVPLVADKFGLNGVWTVLVLMGAVQGPMFPTSSVFLARWMPTKTTVHGVQAANEKAWGSSMLDIGISIGALMIIPISTHLSETIGWRQTFVFVGASSIVFVLVWIWLGASTPAECWFISKEELEYLEKAVANRQREIPSSKKSFAPPSSTITTITKTTITSPAPLGNTIKDTTGKNHHDTNNTNNNNTQKHQQSNQKELLFVGGLPWTMIMHPGLWAVFGSHVAFNFGAYYLTNWSPTYYKDVLELEPKDAKLHLMCPHITNLCVRTLNPALVTIVANKGFSLLSSRKFFTCFGFVMAAICLFPVYAFKSWNPWISTILLSLANASFGLAPTGFKSNYLDITEKYVGIVAGYGNTLGTVASILGPKITAATLVHSDGNWHVVLGTVCIINLVAALNYARTAVVTPVESMILQ